MPSRKAWIFPFRLYLRDKCHGRLTSLLGWQSKRRKTHNCREGNINSLSPMKTCQIRKPKEKGVCGEVWSPTSWRDIAYIKGRSWAISFLLRKASLIGNVLFLYSPTCLILDAMLLPDYRKYGMTEIRVKVHPKIFMAAASVSAVRLSTVHYKKKCYVST